MTEFKEKNRSVAMREPSYLQQKVKSDTKEPFMKCRYVIAFIGFLIVLLLSMQRVIMSVTIVAMVNNSAIIQHTKIKSDSCPSLIINTTEEEAFRTMDKQEGGFVWSAQIQGYVLGSYYLGFIFSQIPVGILAERYGCKWFLFSASLLTGVLNLLIPPVSWFSVYALIFVQTMKGLAQGLSQPSMSVLISNWFPKSERGILCAFIMTSNSLGSFIGSIFTGYICTLPEGWPYSFYTVGIGGLILSVFILFSLAENPKVHPNISKAELDFILSNQNSKLNQQRPKLPWKDMLSSIPVYAYAFGFFGHVWAISHFWTVQSTFLATILHYPIEENGAISSLPFLVQFLSNQISSWISFYMQKNNVASANFISKFWICISSLGYLGCLLGMYFVGCQRTSSVIFGILSMSFIALALPGFSIVSTDLTPTFAGSLQALISTTSYVSTFILPVIVGYLTDEMQTIGQWNKVFLITIGVVALSQTVFVVFGSAEVQPWNFVEEKVQHNGEKCSENYKKCNEKEKYQEATRF